MVVLVGVSPEIGLIVVEETLVGIMVELTLAEGGFEGGEELLEELVVFFWLVLQFLDFCRVVQSIVGLGRLH